MQASQVKNEMPRIQRVIGYMRIRFGSIADIYWALLVFGTQSIL